jgi:hypothetical protein
VLRNALLAIGFRDRPSLVGWLVWGISVVVVVNLVGLEILQRDSCQLHRSIQKISGEC